MYNTSAFCILTIVVVFSITIISTQNHQQSIVTSDNIVTSKNVDKILDKQKLSLVLFYASWQTECQPKVELVDQLYRKFKHQQQEVRLLVLTSN